jgi:hypothetical protein
VMTQISNYIHCQLPWSARIDDSFRVIGERYKKANDRWSMVQRLLVAEDNGVNLGQVDLFSPGGQPATRRSGPRAFPVHR